MLGVVNMIKAEQNMCLLLLQQIHQMKSVSFAGIHLSEHLCESVSASQLSKPAGAAAHVDTEELQAGGLGAFTQKEALSYGKKIVFSNVFFC